jgi:hypothetical protein
MNNYQRAKQASNKLVIKEANDYPAEVSLIPKFAEGMMTFKMITDQIDEVSTQQAKIIKGVAENKNDLIDELNDHIVDVAGAINAYAVSKNDKELQARTKYYPSALARMPQADVIKAAAIVIEEAGKMDRVELTSHGISEPELAEFQTLFTAVKETSSNTRGAIIDHSGYTEKLADLFAQASHLKKYTLDRLATQFRRKAPEFYQKYQAASIVIYKHSTAKAAPTAEAK